VHTAGVLDPNQPDFHGTAAQRRLQSRPLPEMPRRRSSGGTAGVSCFSCHQLAPDESRRGCGACHAYPPVTGRHEIHVAGGALAKQFACSTCHPDHQSGQDHAFASDGSLRTGPAQVSLTGLAALIPRRWHAGGAAGLGSERSNVQQRLLPRRHLPDSAAVTNSPSGMPRLDPRPRPAPSVTGFRPTARRDPLLKLPSQRRRCAVQPHQPTLHLNGTVDFADAEHALQHLPRFGQLTGAAARSAGKYRSFSRGRGPAPAAPDGPVLNIRGPIQCSECHQVPANASSAGHFGTGHAPGTVAMATVFPNVRDQGP
jgi:hypothetical protein